ncbi:NAD-dependent epimerase/dehydratase family protein [Streptomyces sp. R302]|uniref:NAD-dependent epimerase/dehydratase family protein n=1 Tax=unclassified Streptomyces TaxID=2593676 RepID=UPI00145FAF90|nr:MULTISPECIES: NAD-dependent epimerase/dehydratase family protein [unclassified Streptomyces]NML51003.1 NAD-dependent epimerase/dehydratase family protein [Streptomyces sp. R301]NML81097.1 NAD-dependent epimerase/dehydratase family protein [Streptomyces sp. R302]
MLVAVTGGTGFVGAHSVAAIARRGARVRLLVRDPARVEAALAPLGVATDAVEVMPGDVTDAGDVTRFVDGTDAVLHAASVYSFDSRRHAETRRTNVRGTELVLGAAVRSGADPIVHISTVGSMFPAAGPTIAEGSPVGSPRETYLGSKAAAEVVARRHQAAGSPVVITYPPALLGPHDPHLGDQNARLRGELRGMMPLWPLGGFPIGDVRDTAELHARLVMKEAGTGNRFFGPNRYLTTRDYVRAVRTGTGRRLPAAFLPARAMLPFGMLASLAQRVWPWRIPAEYGAVYTCAYAVPVDPSAPTGDVAARPVAETIRDTIRWLHEAGHVSRRQAGTAADPHDSRHRDHEDRGP